MSQTEKYYDNLKEAVEKIAGRKLYSHSDFTELSESIYQKTKTILSPTTLKRFWGYLKNESPTPQKRSLNVLAVFAGHNNWEDFCNYLDNKNDYSSEYVTRNQLHSFLMQPGETIKIKWYPNRTVTLRHEGDTDMFTVMQQKNSKLEEGMTLHCEAFIKGEPLLLRNIKGGSIKEPCDYLCGKIKGIDYEIVK